MVRIFLFGTQEFFISSVNYLFKERKTDGRENHVLQPMWTSPRLRE